MSKAGSASKGKKSVTRKEKNVVLLNQLLSTMLEVISAQSSTSAVSREIAKQIALALRVDLAFVCGWDVPSNSLSLWGEYKGRRAKKATSSKQLYKSTRLGDQLTSIMHNRVTVREVSPSPAAQELSHLVRLPQNAALLFIPIQHGGEPTGLVVAIDADKERKFNEAEKVVSQIFANHAAVILENVQLQDHAQRRATEIEGLRKASLELSSTLDLSEIVDVALRNAQRLLPDVRHVRVYFFEGEELRLAGALAAPGFTDEDFHDPRPEGWLKQVQGSGESLYLGNVKQLSQTSAQVNLRDLAIITMSLQVGVRVLGLIEINYASPRFLDEEMRIARLLSDQTATAVENSRLHARAQQEALTDALTSLPNRRAFDTRLQEELRRAKRYQRVFSLVMIDLNNFKAINDRYGHGVGDLALQEIGRCMRVKVRDTDFLARFGGDEFVLILPETQRADARKVCDKLHLGITECATGWAGGAYEKLTFSYGVAEFPQDAGDASALVGLADMAMYSEKGRSQLTPV